jgi:hypothetical protein
MPTLYSYLFSSDGTGPWWGIRIPRQMYTDYVRRMEDATRLFVHLVNEEGESIVIAVEGPHREEMDEGIFAPDWVQHRLGIPDGHEVMIDPVLEALPAGVSVKVKPLTGRTVEGPMFVEGLTEALNQLGVVQEGRLTAVVDPSTGEEHEFEITELKPASVCLADGELSVDLERAADRPPTPPPPPIPVLMPEAESQDIFQTMLRQQPSTGSAFVPFQGQGHRLSNADSHPHHRLGRGEHPLLQKILRGGDPAAQGSG